MGEHDCGEIYAQFQDKVFRYVSSRILNRTEAEDIVQTVFLKVCKNIDKYDETKASLSTWIYTITRNTVYDYLGKMHTRMEIELTDDIGEQSETAEERMEKQETLNALADALEKLPTQERDVIILMYYHGKRKTEVAAILGITYGQLRYLHDRAVRRLNEMLCGILHK